VRHQVESLGIAFVASSFAILHTWCVDNSHNNGTPGLQSWLVGKSECSSFIFLAAAYFSIVVAVVYALVDFVLRYVVLFSFPRCTGYLTPENL